MPFLRLKLFLFCIVIWGSAFTQINADFTSTTTMGCGSVQVSFCDSSTSVGSDIVSWEWDLGGVSATTECPARVFGVAGVYTICLTVTNAAGESSTICKDDHITVFALPMVDFTTTMSQGCVPLEVTFTDASVGIDGAITDWLWGLGGSCGTSNSPVVTCNYSLADQYSINLTVTDENGCQNTITKPNLVSVSPAPEVMVSADNTFGCTVPHFVNFSNDNPDPNISYSWDFGNGDTFEGVDPPTISYLDPGSNTVTVVATNISSGCSETLILDNYINVGYLVEFSNSVDEGCEDLTVDFEDLSVEAADDVLWEFGDGGTSTDANPTYTYQIPGCYTVKLTRNVQGCTSVAFSTSCINVNPVPDVWYSNDNNSGCSLPHVVNFTGISSSATSWSWDFGDGSPLSTEQNPIHNYTTYGDFDVTLMVTNSQGCSNSVVVNTITLTELQAQLADFQIAGCAPLEVSLSENSISVSPINSWLWEVETAGSTLTSTDQNPNLSIADTGIYNVTLIVTNTLGCMDTATFENAIQVGMLPEINFTADPVETCIEWDVTMTNLSSSFAQEWFWDFGDGQNSIEENPVHSYVDTGHYDISLVAIHNGCANTQTIDDLVHVMAPVSNFNVLNFCENPSLRKFQNLSIDADAVIWDFGDETITTDTSTLTTPEYIYANPGTYVVTQTVFNGETGCSHSTSQEITVTTPEAAFTVSTTAGCVPLEVELLDASAFAGEWTWSSDGGTISDPTAQNPTITFDAPGKYTNIQLIIQDMNSCADTLIFTDTIVANDLAINFTSNIATGCAPLTVDFTETAMSFFGTEAIYTWTFGDLGTSNEQNPTFIFEEPGLHTIKLSVEDDWGCKRTRAIAGFIEVTKPEASFTADTLSCTWGQVNFDNTSSGQQLTYQWDFGDGNFSTEESPSHLYTSESVYTVCLTIKDKFDCEDMICKTNYITIANPSASFSLDSTFASCPPLPVNFYNLSQNANQYTWDYGDGSGISSLEEPSHVYTIPGVYHVSLIAASTEACQDTMVVEDLIVLDGPEGTYAVDIDTACVPATVTFTAESVDNYVYIWDFGTGMLDTSTLSATSEVISFTYTDPGTYTPLLSFVNNTGCFRTLPPIDPIYVTTTAPDFAADQTLICSTGGDEITFANLSNSPDPINSVEWIFEGGDPSMSTLAEPVVNYMSPGSFDVTMIIDNGFCTDTLVREDYIVVAAGPDADFTTSVTEGCAPLMVNFTDNSSVLLGDISEWFWDFGDGTSANIENPTHIFETGSDFEVTMTVTTMDGCVSSTSRIISVFPLTPISAGDDRDVCMGEATQLQAVILADTTGLSYTWTPSNTLSCANCLEPIALPNDTTTYTFSVFSPEGCTSSSEVVVNVKPFPVPVIELTNDTTICANALVQLQASGGDDVFSYQWDQNAMGLSCYESCFNPIAQPTSTTTYTITVTSNQGCSSQDSVEVAIVDEAQSFAGDDQTICEGSSTQLSISFGNDPTWLVNNGLDCTFCPTPIAKPDSTIVYVAQVTTDMGCVIVDSVTVFTVGAEDISAGRDADVCLGDAILLNGVGEGTPTWSPDATLDANNILQPEALPNETTTYLLTLENGACILKDSVTINVREKASIAVSDQIICRGDSIELEVEGDADRYTWTAMSGIVDLESRTPLVFPTETTTFMVVGELSSCEADTAFVTVEVLALPDVSLRKVHRYFPGQTVTLNAPLRVESTIDHEYEWFPTEGLSCTTCDAPEIEPEGENLSFTLRVTNTETGCTNTLKTAVQLLNNCPEDLINMPNAFSPNDDGQNDELEVFLSPAINSIYSLQIFDRWGSLVYSTPSYREFWNGTVNGKRLPSGVYLYLIEAPCPLGGGRFQKTGDITLMR